MRVTEAGKGWRGYTEWQRRDDGGVPREPCVPPSSPCALEAVLTSPEPSLPGCSAHVTHVARAPGTVHVAHFSDSGRCVESSVRARKKSSRMSRLRGDPCYFASRALELKIGDETSFRAFTIADEKTHRTCNIHALRLLRSGVAAMGA